MTNDDTQLQRLATKRIKEAKDYKTPIFPDMLKPPIETQETQETTTEEEEETQNNFSEQLINLRRKRLKLLNRKLLKLAKNL